MDNTSAVYQSLRQEILHEYDREINLAAFSFTVTSALIGYGFTTDRPNPLIFLLPIVILFLLLVQINNSMYTIFTISVFIREFIESESGPAWETIVDEYRNRIRGRRSYHPLKYLTELHFGTAATLMGIVCFLLAYVNSVSLLDHRLLIAGGVAWIIISGGLLLSILRVNRGTYEREAKKDFQDIRQEREARPKVEPNPTEDSNRVEEET